MAVPTLGMLTRAFDFSYQVRSAAGANTDADSAPTYSIFEHENTTAIVTGTMAKFGSNDGFYTEEITLDTADGFEQYHAYQLQINWTISSTDYSKIFAFTIFGAEEFNEVGGGSFPVSLADMKLHLRIESDVTEDDTLITTLISAATTYAQDFQRRTFMTSALTESYDGFPCFFSVPLPPLISVTAIKYIDDNGDEQTLASDQYRVDTASEPGRITEAYNTNWPSTRRITNSVVLTYSAGYGDATTVPTTVKAAIKLLVGNWYENREATISGVNISIVPIAVESLLSLDRVDIL